MPEKAREPLVVLRLDAALDQDPGDAGPVINALVRLLSEVELIGRSAVVQVAKRPSKVQVSLGHRSFVTRGMGEV
ncbi:MAG: hypothetical protein M3P04_03100, partial [Actinomycetota bacterium]|nr:hypothetical protein [Actinomycetota bacterium]